MIKKVKGIVLRTVDYKESSKIINVLLDTGEIIGVLARGCKRLKSPISAVSNVLTYGIFYLNIKDNRMPVLLEVDTLNSFKTIRKDFLKTNYSYFLLELTEQVARHDEKKEIYNLLINGLTKINDNLDAQIITNIIELQFLEYLGIKPVLDRCVNCGEKNDIVTISSYKGGFLCKNCVDKEFVYHLKTLQLLRMFYYVDISKITKIEVSDVIKEEFGLFIDDYYERYSGLYLKSKDLLKELTKNTV